VTLTLLSISTVPICPWYSHFFIEYEKFNEKRNREVLDDIKAKNKKAYMYQEFNPYFENNDDYEKRPKVGE
jgi:hypothetical protein